MGTRKYVRPAVAVLAIAATAVVLLVPLPAEWKSRRVAYMADLGHYVLFGGLTLGFWWLTRYRLWAALGLATALNAVCETAQRFTNRDANLADFLRGLAGSLAVAVVIYALRKSRAIRTRVPVLLAVVVLCGWPSAESAAHPGKTCRGFWHLPAPTEFQSRGEQARRLNAF